jgi:nucleoid-associated protein YgaU
MPALASAVGIPAEDLRDLNPAYGEKVWSGTVSAPGGCVVNVPRGIVTDLAAAFSAIPAVDRVALMDAGGQYRVRTGDTLSSIAHRHGVSVASLQALNGLGQSTRIRPGQRLSIPDKHQ